MSSSIAKIRASALNFKDGKRKAADGLLPIPIAGGGGGGGGGADGGGDDGGDGAGDGVGEGLDLSRMTVLCLCVCCP
jgi:hypothetical protein